MKNTWQIKKILKNKHSFDELTEEEKIDVGVWAFRREDLTHFPKIPDGFTYDQETIVMMCHSWYVYDYIKVMPKFTDKKDDVNG